MSAGVGGAVWAALLAVGGGLGEAPQVAGMPLPLLLLVGGVALGVLLALACRALVAGTARTRAEAADERLRDAVRGVARELVVEPVRGELAAHAAVRAGVATVLKD